jgi:hypothetical protein
MVPNLLYGKLSISNSVNGVSRDTDRLGSEKKAVTDEKNRVPCHNLRHTRVGRARKNILAEGILLIKAQEY